MSKPTVDECIEWLNKLELGQNNLSMRMNQEWFDAIRVQLQAAQEMAKALEQLYKNVPQTGAIWPRAVNDAATAIVRAKEAGIL